MFDNHMRANTNRWHRATRTQYLQCEQFWCDTRFDECNHRVSDHCTHWTNPCTKNCSILRTLQSKISKFTGLCSEHQGNKPSHLSCRFQQTIVSRTRHHRKQHHRVAMPPTLPKSQSSSTSACDISPCSMRTLPYFLRTAKNIIPELVGDRGPKI